MTRLFANNSSSNPGRAPQGHDQLEAGGEGGGAAVRGDDGAGVPAAAAADVAGPVRQDQRRHLATRLRGGQQAMFPFYFKQSRCWWVVV